MVRVEGVMHRNLIPEKYTPDVTRWVHSRLRVRNRGSMRLKFAEKVYRVVERIPEGSVTTYGRIARALGAPRSARMVGWALGHQDEANVPAHRVVNRAGVLSGSHAFGHPDLMRMMLLDEGVQFLDEITVDLERHLWDPADDPSLDYLTDVST